MQRTPPNRNKPAEAVESASKSADAIKQTFIYPSDKLGAVTRKKKNKRING